MTLGKDISLHTCDSEQNQRIILEKSDKDKVDKAKELASNNSD